MNSGRHAGPVRRNERAPHSALRLTHAKVGAGISTFHTVGVAAGEVALPTTRAAQRGVLPKLTVKIGLTGPLESAR